MTLDREKVGSMIKSYLKGELDIPRDAFITLTLTYGSLSEVEPVILTPPPRVVINRIPNPPKKLNVTKNIKDSNFADCVRELETCPLFIQMREICMEC